MEDLKETILLLIEDIPFFDCFSHHEIGILIESGSWIKKLPGDRIITAGEIDFRMFILITGRVQVILNEKIMATLGPGDIFGEVGLMGTPRTAHVEAQIESLILAFDADYLNSLAQELQLKLLKRILLVMITRLQKLNQREWLRHQTRKIEAFLNGSATKKLQGEKEPV
jgi:CRP/FNR family transcriptional regulator, cyclic AMP receptor protein